MPPDRLRLLILIVAYNAESTRAPVLDRLPVAVLTDYDCEVLVIDDASDDGTFEHGLSYRQSHTDLPLTVLRNRSNQGYGGNQKVGYRQPGILDRTHTRLFTFRTLRRLLRDAGFQILVMKGIPAPIPKAIGDSRLSRALLRLNQALIRISPGLFSYQIFVSATVTPDAATVLTSTRASAESAPA